MSEEKDRKPILEVKGLKKYYPIEKGLSKRVVGYVKAVNDVNLTIYQNEVLGVVGESGCGKTTLGRTILRLLEPTDGKIIFHFGDKTVDFSALTRQEVRDYRKYLQMIFQNPYTSLNPRMTVFDIIAEPMRLSKAFTEEQITERVRKLITQVGLEVRHLNRYPHAFSGGQRLLNLLQDMKDQYGLTYMFIAHNLSVVEHISDRVCVMYLGRVVELAETEELFYHPRHPYTEVLMSAIPVADPTTDTKRVELKGDAGNAAHLPSGCPFHPRCRYGQEICRQELPQLREISPGHFTACHLADQLKLSGLEELKLTAKKEE